MAAPETDIGSLSPQKLIAPFSQTRIWRYLAIAVVIHVVVILVTSIGYLRTLVTGEQPAAAVPTEQQPGGPAPAGDAEAATLTTQPVTPTAAGTVDPEKALLEQHKDTKVVQDITEAAKPEEIPGTPDLGISIEDTKIK